ncbi:MAG: MinD/ParA family protein [Oscillospiraceae bacterium]|jgi:flagellar biosynthesis protein FlhG|nr:MinD/ParA family protein [Oscillospiraceae bacterium]
MNDQAAALRRMVQNIKKQRARPPGEGARIVCVTSGKGGVGKTNFAVNLAISLSKKGARVLIVDADFGLANVDVVMGVTPTYDLSHVLRREVSVRDAIFEGAGGVKILSGGSGVLELLNLTEVQLSNMVHELLLLDDMADIILFDTGAGVNRNVLRLIAASREIIVVTTPEPTAIMDAYALIKTIHGSAGEAQIRLVVNRADNESEACATAEKFTAVVRLYLDVAISDLGYILSDPTVTRAVRLQRPFVLSFPRSGAARCMEALSWRFLNVEPGNPKGLRAFFKNLLEKPAPSFPGGDF